MNGWRVECPACAEPYLLPEVYARPGARVRCPGCACVFPAADPEVVEAWVPVLESWVASFPEGVEALRAARLAGRFWRTHGEGLLRLYESYVGPGADGSDAAFRSALARVMGPGDPLF